MSPADRASVAGSDRLLSLIEVRDCILTAIRDFFRMHGYREVTTPVVVPCPGLDRHVEAIETSSGLYLATSPELHMKRLVCTGASRIYQIIPAFRAEEHGSQHKSEFLMLEWYHTDTDYYDMMQETEDLLKHVSSACCLVPEGIVFPIPRTTVDRLYEDTAGWRPSEQWDEERYFRDWVDVIEPCLQTIPAVFLHDFPEALAALSRISSDNMCTCERFELFIDGIELCNAYSELTDPAEHRRRFTMAACHREASGRKPYAVDEAFIRDVEKGMPECSGNALGIDRLIMALTGAGSIDEVSLFPQEIVS
jgi:lysyl-tRNA synthetase class 2